MANIVALTEDSCPDCGQEKEHLTCDECGADSDVINCGHYPQPQPIAASERGMLLCDECAAFLS